MCQKRDEQAETNKEIFISWDKEKYGIAVDWWSLGCCMFELYSSDGRLIKKGTKGECKCVFGIFQLSDPTT